MSDWDDDGGPAFPMASGPEPRHNETTHYNEGMTLRDYFAAKAMQALLTSGGYGYADATAKSYRYADAMLAERSKPGA